MFFFVFFLSFSYSLLSKLRHTLDSLCLLSSAPISAAAVSKAEILSNRSEVIVSCSCLSLIWFPSMVLLSHVSLTNQRQSMIHATIQIPIRVQLARSYQIDPVSMLFHLSLKLCLCWSRSFSNLSLSRRNSVKFSLLKSTDSVRFLRGVEDSTVGLMSICMSMVGLSP